ncbi:hypothetical protein U9M48_026337 [Paspalum notatum var. saurae]|uniref:F-box domain-containing protein n=1 Tax=Paspalum notatum var. saurae TaxID=547442 RepID=A0AAQ3WY81_PASNO
MASELPDGILMQIFAALDVPDLVRAGSVCSAWHAAYTCLCTLGRWKQQQTPCILYTAKSLGESAAGLYSLAEKKTYTLAALPDPPIRSRHFIGSAYGWIVTADERSELHLLNPITGDQIELPSITTIESVTPVYDEKGAIKEYSSWCPLPGRHGQPSNYSLRKLRDTFFDKVFLSSDPSTGDYIVALIHSPYYQFSFVRSGDDCWTSLPLHDEFPHFADCIFKDDLMYAVTVSGKIHVFNFSGPVVKQKAVLDRMRDYWFERVYIVETPCGDLLQIWSDIDQIDDGADPEPEPELLEENEDFSEPDDMPDEYEPCRHYCTPFKLFKVDLAANKLVDVNSLGDSVLFLGQNQTFCLNAKEHPQLKANCVYFTDTDEDATMRKNMIRDVGVLNLCDRSKEKIVSPQIWSNWPSPMWITPNPRKMNSVKGRRTEGTAQDQAPPTSSLRNQLQVSDAYLLLSFQVVTLYSNIHEDTL